MRTCKNYRCKNYLKSWDLKHHSMCPFCHGKIEPTTADHLSQETKIEAAKELNQNGSDAE